MKIGVDVQFALTRQKTGLYNMMTGLVGGLTALQPDPVVLLACQRDGAPYGREDVSWASHAFGGLKVVLERPPRLFYRVWHSQALHSRLDVLVHNLHGVFPASARGANVFIVPDVIPLTVPSGHAGYRDECLSFYRRAVTTGDAVMVLSAHTKNELVTATGADPARVHVVPLGVAPEYRPVARGELASSLPDGLAERPYVLCVSTLEPRKNHAVLLRAFARLIRQRPELPHELVLVGGTREGFTEPFELMRSLGLERRVRHLGFVESLPALYSGADVVVFPSTYEGFGLPPLEAMTCGAAVISSNATSLPEVVGDAGLLFDPQDDEQLATLVARVLGEPALRADLQRRSLDRAAHFSWARAAREFHAVLEGAVASRRQARAGVRAAGLRESPASRVSG